MSETARLNVSLDGRIIRKTLSLSLQTCYNRLLSCYCLVSTAKIEMKLPSARFVHIHPLLICYIGLYRSRGRRLLRYIKLVNYFDHRYYFSKLKTLTINVGIRVKVIDLISPLCHVKLTYGWQVSMCCVRIYYYANGLLLLPAI